MPFGETVAVIDKSGKVVNTVSHLLPSAVFALVLTGTEQASLWHLQQCQKCLPRTQVAVSIRTQCKSRRAASHEGHGEFQLR